MRLARLSVRGFGVLGDREWDLDGPAFVVLGGNEAGKTTFADALAAALYGFPRKRAAGWQEFADRYDPARCRAAAALRPAAGGDIATSSDEPKGRSWVEEAVFRTLLLVRGGECQVRPESGFQAEFTRRVLGGGAVDLDLAVEALESVASGHKNNPWFKALAAADLGLRSLQDSLSRVDALLEASARASRLEAEAADLDSKAAAVEADIAGLSLSAKASELAQLRSLRARLVSCEEKASRRRGLTREAFQRLADLEAGCKALDGEFASVEASRNAANKGLDAAREAEARCRRAFDPSALKALDALDEAAARAEDEARRPAQAGPPAAWKWAAAAAAVLGAAGLLGHLVSLAAGFLAAVAGLLAVAAAWLALARRAGRPAAASEAGLAFQAQLRTMGEGWRGLTPAAARERCAGERQRLLKEAAGIEAEARQADRLQKELDGLRGQEAEARGKAASARERLKEALSAWGAESTAVAREALADAEAGRAELASLLGQASGLLGRNLEDAKAADAVLAERIARLEPELAALPEGAAMLSRQETDDALKRKEAGLASLKASAAARRRESGGAREEAARLEAGLGRRPAEAFAELQRETLRRDGLASWRAAAALALAELGKLRQDTSLGLRACLEEAAPLFEELTGGRYAGLSGDPLSGPDSLEVSHKVLGTKPAAWLSSGGRDSLWLSLRMVLAGRSAPEPGFFVLDEPFLHLDPERMALAARGLLAGRPPLAGWQLIILTKDPRAAEACRASGARLIRLQG